MPIDKPADWLTMFMVIQTINVYIFDAIASFQRPDTIRPVGTVTYSSCLFYPFTLIFKHYIREIYIRKIRPLSCIDPENILFLAIYSEGWMYRRTEPSYRLVVRLKTYCYERTPYIRLIIHRLLKSFILTKDCKHCKNMQK